MNEEAKVMINGTLVKQLREEAGLSQEDILNTHWEIEGKNHGSSRTTSIELRRNQNILRNHCK